MELRLKSGSFQDMTSDNRRLSWYPSFPRRARKNSHKDIFFPRCAIFLARRAIDKVEDGWRFGGGSEAAHFFQIAIYQYITKKFCLRVEDGGTKRKKIQKSIDCDLNMDHNLSSESSREKYMSKNIRIFGEEAVWRQIKLTEQTCT